MTYYTMNECYIVKFPLVLDAMHLPSPVETTR